MSTQSKWLLYQHCNVGMQCCMPSTGAHRDHISKSVLQHWAMPTGGLHTSLHIVQVRFEVTCSLNVASFLLCWSPIFLLISTQSSETRATFLSIASILSISKRTEENKAKRTRKALPREGKLGESPSPAKPLLLLVF